MSYILVLLLSLLKADYICQVCTEVTPTATATATATATPPQVKIVSYTEDTNVIFASPQMGFQSTQKPINEVNNPRSVPSTSEVFRFYAEEVNPSAGNFTWSILDNAINKANAAGQTLNIRIVTYDPYGGSWLRGVIPGYNFRETYEGNGVYFSPDFIKSSALGASQSLLQALANRYNNNSTVEHIDIGTLGSYGEWHHFAMVDPNTNSPIPMPSEQPSAALVHQYKDLFPNKQRLLILDGQWARKYGKEFAGWRADCWGGHHETTLYPQWMTSPVDLREQWRNFPVALEPCGSMLSGNLALKVDQAIAKHASLINTKNAFTYSDAQWAEIRRLLTKLGYRIVVRRAEIRPGLVTLTIENVGIAPNYSPIEFRLGGFTVIIQKLMPNVITTLNFPVPTPATLTLRMAGKNFRSANVEWNNGLMVE